MLQRGSCNGTEIPPQAQGRGARGRRVPDRRGLSPNDNTDLPTEATCMEANLLTDEHFIKIQLYISRLQITSATAKGLKTRHKFVTLPKPIFNKTFNCPCDRYIFVCEIEKTSTLQIALGYSFLLYDELDTLSGFLTNTQIANLDILVLFTRNRTKSKTEIGNKILCEGILVYIRLVKCLHYIFLLEHSP